MKKYLDFQKELDKGIVDAKFLRCITHHHDKGKEGECDHQEEEDESSDDSEESKEYIQKDDSAFKSIQSRVNITNITKVGQMMDISKKIYKRNNQREVRIFGIVPSIIDNMQKSIKIKNVVFRDKGPNS